MSLLLFISFSTKVFLLLFALSQGSSAPSQVKIFPRDYKKIRSGMVRACQETTDRP